MAYIRCPDGVLRDYAEYEDAVKPKWKEKMRKEDIEEIKRLQIVLKKIRDNFKKRRR